jgi:hypothetical protein
MWRRSPSESWRIITLTDGEVTNDEYRKKSELTVEVEKGIIAQIRGLTEGCCFAWLR